MRAIIEESFALDVVEDAKDIDISGLMTEERSTLENEDEGAQKNEVQKVCNEGLGKEFEEEAYEDQQSLIKENEEEVSSPY